MVVKAVKSTHSVSSKAIVVGLLACVFLTGCGGFASSEEVTEIRSLLEDLDVIEAKDGSEPNADSGSDVVVKAPAQGGSDQGSSDDSSDQVVDSGNETPASGEVADSGSDTPVTEAQASATLAFSWTPSKFYEDGTAMNGNEISHYEVIYGTSPNSLDQSSQVSLGQLLTFEMEQTAGSTWYAAVKTISIYGSTSDTSNVIALTF